MNDYKELIENLREMTERGTGCEFDVTMLHCVEKAADAIEQLAKERDAAIADIEAVFMAETSEDICKLCAEYPKHNCFYYSSQKPCNHKWRGVTDE